MAGLRHDFRSLVVFSNSARRVLPTDFLQRVLERLSLSSFASTAVDLPSQGQVFKTVLPNNVPKDF